MPTAKRPRCRDTAAVPVAEPARSGSPGPSAAAAETCSGFVSEAEAHIAFVKRTIRESEQAKEECARVKAALDDARKELEQNKKHISKQDVLLQHQQHNYQALCQKHDTLQLNNDSLTTRLQAKEASISMLQRDHDDLQRQNNTLALQVDQAMHDMHSAEDVADSARQELGRLQRAQLADRQTVSGLEAQISDLVKAAAKREGEIKFYKEDSQFRKNNRLDHLMPIIQRQSDKLDKLKADLAEANSFRESVADKNLLCIAGCGDCRDVQLPCDRKHGLCKKCLSSMAGDRNTLAVPELQCPYRCRQHPAITWALLDKWLAE